MLLLVFLLQRGPGVPPSERSWCSSLREVLVFLLQEPVYVRLCLQACMHVCVGQEFQDIADGQDITDGQVVHCGKDTLTGTQQLESGERWRNGGMEGWRDGGRTGKATE